MEVIGSIFGRLAEWRNLPDYQLERRVDIFFAPYLQDIIGDRGNIHNIIIPEFPLRLATLYEGDKRGNQSVKIDYLAATRDLTKIFFIELKTDIKSIDLDQCKNMVRAAEDIGMKQLVDGNLKIFKATTEKRKYYYLLEMLESIGVIKIPGKISTKMKETQLNGINRLLSDDATMSIDDWYVSKGPKEYEVCYILPRKSEILTTKFPNVRQITFNNVVNVVSKKRDEFSKRFVSALKLWAKRM